MRILRLITTYYKSFAFASSIITLSCTAIAYFNGIRTLALLFWFKIFTLGVIFYFINVFKKKEFYYYRNVGVSKFLLWISTILFDTILFILLLALTVKFR